MPQTANADFQLSPRVSDQKGFSTVSALVVLVLVGVLVLCCAALAGSLRHSMRIYSKKKEAFQLVAIGGGVLAAEDTCNVYLNLAAINVLSASEPVRLHLKVGQQVFDGASVSRVDPKASVAVFLRDLKDVTASGMASLSGNRLYMGQMALQIGGMRDRSLGALYLETNSGGRAVSCFQVPSKERLCRQSGGIYQASDANCVLQVKTEVVYKVVEI